MLSGPTLRELRRVSGLSQVEVARRVVPDEVAEIKADPEIGGERLGAAVAAASRVLERLAIPGLREALNVTGAGNHPAIVKAFVRIGRLLAEDRFSPGRDGPAQAHRSPADVIYGGQPLK